LEAQDDEGCLSSFENDFSAGSYSPGWIAISCLQHCVAKVRNDQEEAARTRDQRAFTFFFCTGVCLRCRRSNPSPQIMLKLYPATTLPPSSHISNSGEKNTVRTIYNIVSFPLSTSIDLLISIQFCLLQNSFIYIYIYIYG